MKNQMSCNTITSSSGRRNAMLKITLRLTRSLTDDARPKPSKQQTIDAISMCPRAMLKAN